MKRTSNYNRFTKTVFGLVLLYIQDFVIARKLHMLKIESQIFEAIYRSLDELLLEVLFTNLESFFI